MTTKRKYLKITFIIVAILAAVAGIMWLAFILFPYLTMIIAFPVWLAVALSDGAKV